MKNLLTSLLIPVIWLFNVPLIQAQDHLYAEKGENDLLHEALAFRVNSGDTNTDFPVNENYVKKEPMLYKLYKERTKPSANQANSNMLVDDFKKIYDKNDVKLVGLWINADDPHEQYYMTGYRDESHYNEFVEKVKADPKYREMSEKINKDRESIESVTLIPASEYPVLMFGIKSKDQPHLYKLYKEKTKTTADQSSSNNLIGEFKKIYDKNGVKVIGLWINADDPHEQYFMTGYKDEAHYQDFVEKEKDDPKYQEMSAEIDKDRESIKAITLIPAMDK